MFASSVNFVQMCPPEMAGVAGAWTSVLVCSMSFFFCWNKMNHH